MKNIKLLTLEKYGNTSNYQLIEEGIYKKLTGEDSVKYSYRIALSFELESERGEKFPDDPMMDILELHFICISDLLCTDMSTDIIWRLELSGKLEDIIKLKSLVGKRVYNKITTESDGNDYVELIIEPQY